MNEKALQYSFELFSKDGYEGSIEDYKELIGSNKEALDYSYSLFSGDGFDGDESKFSELVGVTSAKTNAVVGEDAATPADTVLASEDGSLESLEINQPEQDETSKFLSGLNYLPPISDIKEDTKAVEEKVGADKKPSIKDPFSFQSLTMASEERGPDINSQINLDKDKENQLNYLAKENPIVLSSIEGMSLTTEDVGNKIQTKKDSLEYNNSFLRTKGLDEPTRNSYKDDNQSLNYDILNLQLVKAQKDINNESFDYSDFSEIKRGYNNLYGGAIPINVELLNNAEQAYLNIEQHINKDLNSEIKNLDMDALTKIDNNGSERADIDKITEAAEKLTLKKTGISAYKSPLVYSMAYETIRNLAEQNGKLKAANKIVSNNPEVEELKGRIGKEKYDAFISGSEYYKAESNAYSQKESQLKNEFNEKQLELQSEFELFSKEKTSELQANISNGLISAVDANEELAKYNAALFKNVRARESSLVSITDRKSDSLLNDFNKSIASEQEEFNKKYKIPNEDQELLSNIYSEAWAKASENERYRLKSDEERYSYISPQAAIVLEGIPNIGKEINNAIGRSISSFGVMSNNPLFIEIGDDMKSNFSVAEDNLQNFSDLTDFSKVTKSIGRGLGSALPSIVVGSTVTALSGGIGTIPAMGLVASAGWISETSDMAGSIYRDTYAETGSLLKAEQASSELINKQLENWYLYTLDGIPFVGKSLKRIPTAAGRIAVAGVTESITETGQEVIQTAQEETISKSVRSGGPITASGWKERINSGMIKNTFLEVAPSSMLMGVGGRTATEYQDTRNRNKFVEGIINQYKLSAVDENGSFIAQKIGESVFQHGENFTTSWISTLLETGKITEREFSNLSRKVAEYKLLKQDFSFFNKLSPKDKDIYILLSHNVSALDQEAKDSQDGKVLNTKSTEKARAELKEFVKDPMLWNGDYVNISIDEKSFLMTSDQFSDLMLVSPEMFSEGNNVSVNIFNNPELSKEFNNLLGNKQEINETATETTEQPATDVPSTRQDNKQKVEELRAEEQAELLEAIPNSENYLTDGKVDKEKITNPEDKAEFEKIYDRYDKLISPLLEAATTEESSVVETQAEPTVVEYQKALDILEPLGSEYSSLTVNQLQEVYEALGENSENVIDISKKQNAQSLYVDLSNKKEALESSVQDVTPEVQEEVDTMEADENLDMSGFDNARFSVAEEGDELLVLSESTDVEAIADDMVELLPDQVDYTAPQGEQVSVDPLAESNSSEEFTDEDAKKLDFESKEEMTKPIEYFNGMPMVFGVSDILGGGTIKDAIGNAMKVSGGLMFNALSKFKAAWAGVEVSKSGLQVDAAVKVYEDNKSLFERLWKEGKIPYGHVPMAITRMGDDAVHSNEAVFRYLAPEVKSQPIENQTAALNDIVAALEKSETPGKKKILEFIKKEKVSTFGELLDVVISDANKRAKAKSKADLKSTLTLDVRTLLFSLITTDSKTAPKSGFLNSLYKGSENNNYSLFIPGNIRKAIAEPSMLKSKKGDIVSIVGVDVLNPEVVDIDHPNYGTGPKGRLIALISNPVNGTNIFPTWRAKSSRVNKPTTKGDIPDAAKILKETMGTAPGDVAFRGDSPVANMTDLDILVGKLKFAFPKVTVINTKQEFEKALSEPGVRTKITKGKVILGMTKDGKVFLNPELESLNTPIHEFGHIWIDYLRSKSSGDKGTALLQRGLKLTEGTKELETAIKKYGDNKLAREEALVDMMASKGETLIGAAKSRFKEWMNALFKYIQSKLVLSENLFQTENIKALNAERKKIKGKKVLTKKDKARVDKIGSEIEKIESSVFKDIKKLSIDEFINTGLADLFKGKPVNSSFDAAKASEGMKPRFELSDNVNNIIKQARGQGYSEAAIEAFLKKRGVDPSIITSALSDKTKPASKRLDMNKVKPEGYDRVMTKREGVIAKTKARNTADSTSTDILFKNSLSYLQGTKSYENATDVQRELLVRDLRKKLGFKEKSAPSTNKVLATPKSKIGAIDEMVALKNQVKLEARSSRLSIKDLNEKRKELSGKISELKKNGKISTNQARVIINKIGSVNLYNVKSVDSFLNYMEKVYNNADYADRVVKANSLKNNIKKLSKSKNLDPVLARLGESFQKISIRLIDDIDKYTKIAESVEEGLKGSKIKGTEIDWMEALNVKETEAYIEAQIKKQEAVILENKRQEFLDITGLDASKLSYNEMMSILNDPKEEAVDKTKEKLIRDNIQKVFNSYKTIIKSIIEDGRDPFSLSGEKVSLPNKNIIKRFMDMKISDMEIRDAIRAVDALNNYMVNGLTSGMEGIVSVYEGGKKTEALVKRAKIKAKPLKLFGFKAVGRVSGEELTTLPILIERMFKSQENARKVMNAIGLDGIIRGKASAIKDLNLIIDSYLSEFEDRKPNGKAFNDSSNIIERGMVGFARRTVMGNDDAVKVEFNRRKDLIKESISVLREGTDKEKKKSEEYQSVYDKILKDSESIQDVDNKADKVNLTAVKWWGDKFSGYYSEMADVSLNIYNDILDLSVNYNPDSFTSTEGKRKKEGDFDWGKSAMSTAQSSLVQKKSGSLEAVKLPRLLNTNTYISLDFDTNNAAILKAALIDIRTAADIQVLKGALASDYFKELVPTKEDREVLESRLKGYVRNTRGKNLSTDKMSKDMQEALNILASLGVSRALGGITQPLKQMGPVAVNTLINAGRLDLEAIFDVDFNKWLDASGYSIANRGFASDTTLDNINRALEQQAKSKARKSLLFLEKVNKMWLETFLVKPDAAIARSSWQSYYKQSLKKQGLEYGNIDWKTHEINKVAGAYAEQQVSRQQNVSDSDLQGDFMTSKNPYTAIARKVLIPFQNFVLNQKQRMYSDIIILTSKTSSAQDKSSAARSLAGLAGEMATYYGIRLSISTLLFKATAFMMGYDESEEEEEKRIKQNEKSIATGAVTDLLSPMPLTDPLVKGVFNKTIGLFQQDIPEKERFKLWNKTEKDWLESLGIFGMPIQGALNLGELGDMAYTGKYTSEYMGNKTIKTIPSKSQDMLKLIFTPALAYTVGLLPSEVGTVTRYAVKIAKKQSKTDDQMEYKGPKLGKKNTTESEPELEYGSPYLKGIN